MATSASPLPAVGLGWNSSSPPLPLISPSPSPLPSPSPSPSPSPDAASYVCPELQQEFHWYLAIGSMINPTSLALRKLTPVESHPAILRGWRLVFRGDCGMASILPADSLLPSMLNHASPRSDFHGVLHRLSREMMSKLDVIESSYDRLEVKVELYDGRMQRCFVYKMCESKLDPSKPDALPSERYIDIISRGCEHFKIAPEYISWLRAHACVKRKQPSEYKKIPIHEFHQRRTDRRGRRGFNMTADELRKYDGSTRREDLPDAGAASAASASAAAASTSSPSAASGEESGEASSSSSAAAIAAITLPLVSPSPPPLPDASECYPLRIAVNRKVLEWVGDLSQPLLANTFEFMRFNFGGTDCTHSYSCIFFEPMYPPVPAYKDMPSQHRAMIEDIFYWKINHANEAEREWKLVGLLSNEEQKESQEQARAKMRSNARRRTRARVPIGSGGIGGGPSALSRGTSVGPLSEDDSAYGGGSSCAEDPSFEDDDESTMEGANMFLALSMEDHSGASSTCFAFCCAGAQPFDTQRRRERAIHAGGPGAHAALMHGGHHAASHGAQGHQQLKPLSRAQKAVRQRRHSIGNVGLHEQQALAASVSAAAASSDAAAAASPAASRNSVSFAADSTAASASSASASTAAFPHSSGDTSASGSSAAHFSGGGGSVSSSAAAGAIIAPRVRAASICTGSLASYHAAALLSPASSAQIASFAQSPRRRINSADGEQRMGPMSPQSPPPALSFSPGPGGAEANDAPTPMQSPVAQR